MGISSRVTCCTGRGIREELRLACLPGVGATSWFGPGLIPFCSLCRHRVHETSLSMLLKHTDNAIGGGCGKIFSVTGSRGLQSVLTFHVSCGIDVGISRRVTWYTGRGIWGNVAASVRARGRGHLLVCRPDPILQLCGHRVHETPLSLLPTHPLLALIWVSCNEEAYGKSCGLCLPGVGATSWFGPGLIRFCNLCRHRVHDTSLSMLLKHTDNAVGGGCGKIFSVTGSRGLQSGLTFHVSCGIDVGISRHVT